MIRKSHREIYLEVDGGINEETILSVKNAGADAFVAATAIFGNPKGISAGVQTLRQQLD
jgi:ribulose-phosphate 3-epimerase